MLLKKSLDYFRTLKEMSLSVGNAYSQMIKTNEFNKEIIRFSGLKWELSNNLVDEFVAPIERNDIYNLSYCLNEEIYYINKLSNILQLLDYSYLPFTESFNDAFSKQNEVFRLFCNTKNYDKTLKFINESKAVLNGLNMSVILSVKSSLRSTQQPLLQYTAISCFLELFKSIEKTIFEVERVIINNN